MVKSLITYQHSGAHFIQVQSIQKKKGLRYTLHSSTTFIRWEKKKKENQQVNFTTTKLSGDNVKKKENIHIREKVSSIKQPH